MDADLVANFFALVLLGGTAALAVSLSRHSTREQLRESALPLAALAALGATLGSLYLSEIAGFVPCELCWYQRIAMYPLAVVLGMAVFRKDSAMLKYAIVVAGAGFAIALYHIQLQAFPEQSSFCDISTPCTASPTKAFGWMTIPQMSALSFAWIITLASVSIFPLKKEIA